LADLSRGGFTEAGSHDWIRNCENNCNIVS
jgi:hypothetical protein